MKVMPLWRQGDVLMETVESIPEGAVRVKGLVLAAGEVTGHRHRVEDRKSARLYTYKRAGAPRAQMFLEVLRETADVVHPEHDTITLPRGMYRVWQQREATAFGTRTMVD